MKEFLEMYGKEYGCYHLIGILAGTPVADKHTGFMGRATAVTLDKSLRFLVEGRARPDGGEHTRIWLEGTRLQILTEDEYNAEERAKVNVIADLGQENLELLSEINTLQDLLDEVRCMCTLSQKCPAHDPGRPARRDE